MKIPYDTFGRSVYLTEGLWRSTLYKAIVQPIRKEPETEYTVLGKVILDPYLYIGPPAHDLRKLGVRAFLTDAEGVTYSIESAKLIYAGDKPCYIRATLNKRNEVN